MTDDQIEEPMDYTPIGREKYNEGWSAGYDAALDVLRGIGAPAIIDTLSGAFVGDSGKLLAEMVAGYKDAMRPQDG